MSQVHLDAVEAMLEAIVVYRKHLGAKEISRPGLLADFSRITQNDDPTHKPDTRGHQISDMMERIANRTGGKFDYKQNAKVRSKIKILF